MAKKRAKGYTHITIRTREGNRGECKKGNKGKKITEENKSLTVQEILARFAGGIMPNATRNPIDLQSEDLETPDIMKVLQMDIADRREFLRENKRRVEHIANMLTEQGQFKEEEPTEEEKKISSSKPEKDNVPKDKNGSPDD